jgi:23S rRNA (cytosine1962-C5)-methyltransferase
MATAYEVIDSGEGRKLERFGDYRLIRPCSQAIWRPREASWSADAEFVRDSGWKGRLPNEWEIEIESVVMQLRPTDFGHLGLFPEHAMHIEWLRSQQPERLLNLFAYSGLISLALGKQCAVCHVDAAKGMVEWAKENAARNAIDSIRWIVDDAVKFMKREVRRGAQYDAVVLDPPTFGRGRQGEVFKLERDILTLLELTHALKPKAILLTCHTPGVTPTTLSNLLGARSEAGEVVLGDHIPSGVYGRWLA